MTYLGYLLTWMNVGYFCRSDRLSVIKYHLNLNFYFLKIQIIIKFMIFIFDYLL